MYHEQRRRPVKVNFEQANLLLILELAPRQLAGKKLNQHIQDAPQIIASTQLF